MLWTLHHVPFLRPTKTLAASSVRAHLPVPAFRRTFIATLPFMSSEQEIKSVAVCDESELKNGEMKQCEFGEDGKVLVEQGRRQDCERVGRAMTGRLRVEHAELT